MESKNTTQTSEPRTFKPTPEGFNPIKATDKELLIYGYPPRPDAKTKPEQAKLWEGFFSKNPTMIVPEIKTIELKKEATTYHPDTTQTSDTNAGSTITADGSFVSIQAKWNVPTCKPTNADSTNGGNYTLNTYVVVHGHPNDVKMGVTNSPSIFYIFGNTLEIEFSKIFYSIGNSVNIISNFPVNYGEEIFVAMCYNATSKAMSFWLANYTLNVWTPIPEIASVYFETLNGIGWSVDSGKVWGAELPKFNPIVFQSANAEIRNTHGVESTVGADTGTLLNLVDSNSNVIATTTTTSTNSISVQYTGGN